MMRIAYVCPHYAPRRGGVETHVSEIASRLAARGHAVEVLTLAPGREESTEELDGVTVRRFRAVIVAGRRVVPWRLWRHLRTRPAAWDLLHAHDFGRTTALAAAYAGIEPFVFTPHFHGLEATTWAGKAIEGAHRAMVRRVLKRAARVVCVSEAEAEQLGREFPGAAGRTEVIPNGVPRAADRDRERPREPLVLSLGRVEGYKNIDAVIAALRHLPAEFRLQVVGDGSARPGLTALAASHGVGDRVKFIGQVSDIGVAEAFASSSVLVTMSDHEAFGLAPLEAMAAGVPVVASDIPAHRELHDRYGDGCMRLVPPGVAPERLAAAISEAAARGCRPSPRLPTWDRVTDMTLDLYKGLVSVGPRG